MIRPTSLCVVGLLAFLPVNRSTSAQELEPRAYVPSPTGVTFLLAGYGRQTGSVLFDPSLPFEDVEATLDSVTAGVGHTFGIFGRQALFVAAFPVVWADVSGEVGDAARRVTRTGLADPRFKLSVNLHGSPALRPAAFMKAAGRRRNILAASLTVVPPLGQYSRELLINLGGNRWAFKPELGFSRPVGRVSLDAYAGVWFFTTNESFYPGSLVRRQSPLVSLQAHASYNLTPRAWAAVDVTWYSGGRTTIEGVGKADLLRNSRVGGTLSLPIGRRQSLKFGYSTGATTRVGGDFNTFAVGWQIVVL
jgi:Putative MetA-pathway of phenol degradation